MLTIYQIAIGLLATAAVSILFQSTASMIDEYRYPPLGSLIDLGSHQLHIHSMGKGGPAVVLDAGLGGTSLGWSLVQSEVAKFTQVCSYDRAGYGWSHQAPTKRTSYNIAEELRALLHKAKIDGSYILVGHSFGGCNVLMFANEYPEETLGVILVDSVHQEMLLPSRLQPHPKFQWLLSVIGYKRLKGPSAEIAQMFQPLPETIRHMYVAQMNKTSYTKTVSSELECLKESLFQLAESRVKLEDKRLIVITACIVSDDQEGKIWSKLQKKHLLRSNRAKQLIADDSDHMINHHQPSIIIDAIREIVNNSL